MNYNDKVSGKMIFAGLIVVCVVIYFLSSMAYWIRETPHSISQPAAPSSPPIVTNSSENKIKPENDIFSRSYKPETEKQYKASCKKIIQTDSRGGIYYKELLKNPGKFIGDRLQFPAKIMSIEETGNSTAMQVYISNKFDSVIVHYSGVMKIYEGDIIQIYGEGDGTFEGENRMGVKMSVPKIRAQYIKKLRSDE